MFSIAEDDGGEEESWDVPYAIEEDYEADEKRWVLGISDQADTKFVGAVAKGRRLVMWDTGSDDHVCRPDFGYGPIRPERGSRLVTVGGDDLGQVGRRTVMQKTLDTSGKKIEMVNDFSVSSRASKEIASGGKFLRAGGVTSPLQFEDDSKPVGT